MVNVGNKGGSFGNRHVVIVCNVDAIDKIIQINKHQQVKLPDILIFINSIYEAIYIIRLGEKIRLGKVSNITKLNKATGGNFS